MIFDTIENIATVKTNIATIQSKITDLVDYSAEINAIKEKVSQAWDSENAKIYIDKLNNIVKELNGDGGNKIGAIQSLQNYLKKINGVVQQLEHFDNTIKYE